MYIEIKKDLFDIVERIRQIDNDYYVLYDLVKGRYELHHSKQENSTYCLSFGSKLDERAVSKTLKTRRENRDELMKELERENQWK